MSKPMQSSRGCKNFKKKNHLIWRHVIYIQQISKLFKKRILNWVGSTTLMGLSDHNHQKRRNGGETVVSERVRKEVEGGRRGGGGGDWGGGRQTRRGSLRQWDLNSERPSLCFCVRFVLGAQGALRKEGKRRGWGSYPGPQTSSTLSSPVCGGTCGVTPLFRPVEGTGSGDQLNQNAN